MTALEVVGLTCITIGAALAWGPAGWLVAGAALVWVGEVHS